MALLTTPAAITDEVRSFCSCIEPEAEPAYISVRPILGAPFNDCYPLADGHVARHGGSAVHGWAIWYEAGVFIEAEFHAVWEAPSGERIDLSPKADGETTILFLPSARRFEGEFIPNVRRPLVDSAENRGRMAAGGRMDRLKRKYWAQITAETAVAAPVIVESVIGTPRVGRNDPCPCGSGKKVKKCCGA